MRAGDLLVLVAHADAEVAVLALFRDLGLLAVLGHGEVAQLPHPVVVGIGRPVRLHRYDAVDAVALIGPEVVGDHLTDAKVTGRAAA